MINLIGNSRRSARKLNSRTDELAYDALIQASIPDLPRAAKLLVENHFHGDLEEGTKVLIYVAQIMVKESDRARGLALFRLLPGLHTSRRAIVATTLLAASFDDEFRAKVSAGDEARDNGLWAEGEHNYWTALSLYPEHAGYIVQYAHCIKEQDKHIDAECFYRHALALGAPMRDVAEHLIFVARHVGFAETVTRLITIYGEHEKGDRESKTREPLSLAPSKTDVDILLRTFLHRPAHNLEETLQLLRTYATRSAVVSALIRRDDFRKQHRDLIAVIAEIKGTSR